MIRADDLVPPTRPFLPHAREDCPTDGGVAGEHSRSTRFTASADATGLLALAPRGQGLARRPLTSHDQRPRGVLRDPGRARGPGGQRGADRRSAVISVRTSTWASRATRRADWSFPVIRRSEELQRR